jgi:hypothetical protein
MEEEVYSSPTVTNSGGDARSTADARRGIHWVRVALCEKREKEAWEEMRGLLYASFLEKGARVSLGIEIGRQGCVGRVGGGVWRKKEPLASGPGLSARGGGFQHTLSG